MDNKDIFKDFEMLEQSMLKDKIYHSQQILDKNVEQGDPQEMMKRLNHYLQCLIQAHSYAKCLYRFLEISFIKIDSNSKKYKETFMFKKGGILEDWSLKMQKRYLVITSEGVKYSYGAEKDNCKIKGNFVVNQRGQKRFRKYILEVESESKQFETILRCNILPTDCNTIIPLYKDSQIRFICRAQSSCKWYVDGSYYYQEVYNTILQAKETIFITDWWLSPELYLVRPVSEKDHLNSETRLDKVLKSVAERGIQSNIALTNDSANTKEALERQSTNIKVLRHPFQLPPKLLSHHEKMVVIDNKVGFMGGLDLCFGRMDTQKHHLFEPNEDSSSKYWPGIDFSNSRMKDFINVQQTEHQLIPNDCPRMPWHDIALRLTGETVKDMTRHFIQYSWIMETRKQRFDLSASILSFKVQLKWQCE